MRLVLLGPPGAGKGTQARLLSERLALPHISTGEVLRQEIEKGTELGEYARNLIEKGNLVTDEVANTIALARLSQPDVRNGFIMDGYPRTVPQAEALNAFLKERGEELTAVIDFDVDETEIVRRVSGRRACPGCGASFHLTTIPSLVPGQCDFCGTRLQQREDDSPEVTRRRLQIYRLRTQPLIDYYHLQRKLVPIDARHGVERTFEAVLQKLKVDDSEDLT